MGRHYTRAIGFNPVFAFVGRNGVALNSLLRPGNQKDSSGLEGFLQETLVLLPPALRPRLLARFDSGFYSRRNITTLLNEGVDFVVKARLCDALRTAVTEELEAGRIDVDLMPYGADVYGEFSYRPEGWPQPLRYCFCLQIEEKEQDGQMLLLPRRQDLILVTTLPAEEATARQMFEAYRRRGRAEQFIKELKGPLNLEQLPTQSFRANEVLLGRTHRLQSDAAAGSQLGRLATQARQEGKSRRDRAEHRPPQPRHSQGKTALLRRHDRPPCPEGGSQGRRPVAGNHPAQPNPGADPKPAAPTRNTVGLTTGRGPIQRAEHSNRRRRASKISENPRSAVKSRPATL